MASRPGARELGAHLTRLKEKSGHSYAAIGRKTNLSKSAVHRYCSGLAVPPEFGTVERIALKCGATKDDLARLYRLWEFANGTAAGGSSSGLADSGGTHPDIAEDNAEDNAGESGGDVRTDVSGSAAPHPVQSGRAKRFLSLAGCLVALFALTLSASRPFPHSPRHGTAVHLPRALRSWKLPDAALPREYFGVTLNSGTGHMPGFRVGAVRLWDSGTRWSQLQPHRGRFDWSRLDREVQGARRASRPVLFVLGGTPGWARPDAPRAPYPDGARTGPPADLSRWDAFTRALVHRYRGDIEAYELWPLANDRRFYSGSVGTMVEMTRRASRIIRREDPRAKVVCPGMGRLWTSRGRRYLERFARLGGYDACDAASVKVHQRSAAEPPETMLEVLDATRRSLHKAGAMPVLWNTGTTYGISLEKPLPPARARDYAVRYFLVGIYARQLGLRRAYFYSWGSRNVPIVLQAEGRPPTPAALAVQRLQTWLAHARVSACGHGGAAGLPARVWQCSFRLGARADARPAVIRWTDSGSAETRAHRGQRRVRRLDGTSAAVSPGDTVRVSEAPVLIE